MLEMVAMSVLDLRDQMNANYEQLARGHILAAFGQAVGSVASGILFGVFPRSIDILTASCIIVFAAAHGSVAWLTQLYIYEFAMLVMGLTKAVYSVGCEYGTVVLWDKKSAPFLQLLQLCHGLGGCVATQLLKPFLLPRDNEHHSDMEPTRNISNFVSTVPVQGHLWIPYTISAMLGTVSGAGLLVLSFHKLSFHKTENKTVTKNKRCFDIFQFGIKGKRSYIYALIILCILFATFATGGEKLCASYIYAYAVNGAHFTESAAANLGFVFYSCFLLGRFLGIFLTRVMHLHHFLFIALCGSVVTSGTGLLRASDHALALWLVTGFEGIFTSVLGPACMAWINLYIHVNSALVMCMQLGASVANFVYIYIPGPFFDKYGMQCFMYILLHFSISISIIFCVMFAIGYHLGPRDDAQYDSAPEDTEKLINEDT